MRVKLYDQFTHWYHGGTIWLISDTHFDDNDCEHIDSHWPTPQEYVNLINKFVGKNDTLIHLGDVGNTEWIKKIKGYKVLLLGNHDKGASNYLKKYFSVLDNKVLFESHEPVDIEAFNFEYFSDFNKMPGFESNKLFDEVYEGPIFINEKICLSHEPIHLEFGYNIHGHRHSGMHSVSTVDTNARINITSNIVNFKPLRLDNLISKFKVKDIHRVTINKAIERENNV